MSVRLLKCYPALPVPDSNCCGHLHHCCCLWLLGRLCCFCQLCLHSQSPAGLWEVSPCMGWEFLLGSVTERDLLFHSDVLSISAQFVLVFIHPFNCLSSSPSSFTLTHPPVQPVSYPSVQHSVHFSILLSISPSVHSSIHPWPVFSLYFSVLDFVSFSSVCYINSNFSHLRKH